MEGRAVSDTGEQPNLREAVPFLGVTDMQASARFYTEGLGFAMPLHWSPGGELRWCRVERDGVGLMLQQFHQRPAGRLGEGVTVCLMCADALALYHEFTARGVVCAEPFVGNGLWVVDLVDPDGYRLEFESPTDVPEETRYTDWANTS
ncbi:MAG: VOC family protein [Armatimonadetes bacterium]|nr:VOC family protein [Armatimonadota bacterium]